MRYLIILLIFISGLSYGQGVTNFGATRPQDTGLSKGQIKLPALATSDSNLVLGTDSRGVIVFRHKGGNSGGSTDTAFISRTADSIAKQVVSDSLIGVNERAIDSMIVVRDSLIALRNDINYIRSHSMQSVDFADSFQNHLEQNPLNSSTAKPYSSTATEQKLVDYFKTIGGPITGDVSIAGDVDIVSPNHINLNAPSVQINGNDIPTQMDVDGKVSKSGDVMTGPLSIGTSGNNQPLKMWDDTWNRYLLFTVDDNVISYGDGSNTANFDIGGGSRNIVVRPIDGTMALLSDITGAYVTSVTIANIHGVSATNTGTATDPVFNFSLGAITPSSVVATGTVSGSNLSGTNTGDQTTITGNAGTATALQTARTINGTSFNGTANITVTASANTLTGTILPALSGVNITTLNGSNIASGTVALSRGGTGSDLSATGGTGQVVKQSTSGGALTVGTITTSDISGLGTGIATFLTTPSSANFFASITDETGSGAVVGATSPVLVTPSLGVATATSINKVTITTPATGSTLTIADNKTCTVNNTLTLGGTDGTTMTFPSTNATIARTDAAQTFTGLETFSNGFSASSSTFTGSPTLASSVNLIASNTSIIGGNLTTTQTINYATGVTASAQTKTVHFADAGATGSTTIITLGSASGTSTTAMNGVTSINQIARLFLSTGANTGMVTAALSSGTVTVSNTSVTANSKFNIDYNPGGQSIGIGNVSTRFYVSTITAGTSFVVVAETLAGVANTTDNSTLTILIAN